VPGAAASAGPAERRLVAACVLLRDGAALAPLLEVGWVGVLWLASAHGVLEAVAHALLSGFPRAPAGAPVPPTRAGALPPDVRAQLAEVSAATAARNALVLSELARAQAVLAGAGIPSAALKGTALLAAHYPSLAARAVSDIDLLVRPRELAAAAAALAAAGIAPPPGALPAVGGGEDALARNPGWDHVRALVTWDGVVLELHDRLPGGGADPDAVVAGARRATWQGRALDLAAPDDLAGMLCRHVFLKHGDDLRLRTRHVVDLAALERSVQVDWRAVRARYGGGAGGWTIRRSLALVEAARREADGAGKTGLLTRHEPSATERASAALHRGLATLAAPGALRAVFPARRYMEARFGLRPGSPLLPLLYPWRLLRGIGRKLARPSSRGHGSPGA
jgi:hypothetical protein